MLRRHFLQFTALAALATMLPTAAQANQGATQMSEAIKSGYVPVEGGQVYYAIYGSGEPLVLLHGGLMTIEDFGPVLSMLAEVREVIAIEAQGHGRTGPLDRPMSYKAMAADVASVIAALGYEKVDVLGYSMGGSTGLRLALDRPELVDRLVVASAPYAFSGWHDYNQEGMRSMSAALIDQIRPSPMYDAFAAVNPDPETNFVKLLDQMSYIGKDYDWSSEISDLAVPTQLVVGDWDAVRTSHTARFFELLGGGLQDALWDGSGMNHNSLSVLPGVTHYTMMTSPQLAETALAFFSR